MATSRALSGRRVVITGAGRGLGRALAIVVADEGAELVLLGRDPAKLRSVAEVIQARTGRDSAVVPCDLAQPESVKEACRQTLAAGPVVDVLVNNGAPWLPGRFADLVGSEIASTIAAGATGTILVTQGLLPGLRNSRAGDVVTIVSTSALRVHAHEMASVAFTAAKHAQSGFSDQLRAELKEHAIRVTAIYPPDFDDTDPQRPEWNEIREKDGHRRLTNREVVAAVLFAITAPRVVAYTNIVLDNMWQD